MSGIKLENRLAIAAILNGLRQGGEVGERTMSAIADALRAAAAVSDDMLHTETSGHLRQLAGIAEQGGTGK